MMTEIKADRYKHFVNFNKEAYLLKIFRGASRGRCVRHAHRPEFDQPPVL